MTTGAHWARSPIGTADFFPIMVWAQEPSLAPQYGAMGVNTYLALWQGPTDEQLAELKKNGMYAICAQNEVGLAHLDDPTIIAWMHGDEPDNRQKETGGPVALEKILADYKQMKKADPTRPVVMNLGQGVANDAFPGRALKLDQYPAYITGCDIVSYDVYPVVNIKVPGPDGRTVLRPDGADFLWYVAKGVDRLGEWVDHRKPVWNVIECTHIGNPDRIATPHQIRAEVWMSLIHGSRGICWFVHDFREEHRSASAVLNDAEMVQALTAINQQITSLASVLNSPTIVGGATVQSSNKDVPIDIMVKRHGGSTYLFAVGMRNAATHGTFHVADVPNNARVAVLGEGRMLTITDGRFSDDFAAYDAHLYRVTPTPR